MGIRTGQEFRCESLEDLVEDVEVPLLGVLVGQTCLLQEVVLDISRRQFGVLAEVHTDELSETRGVVVPDGLGVSVGFKHGIAHDNLGGDSRYVSCLSYISQVFFIVYF